MQERMSLSKYKSSRGTTHLARIARAILGPCVDVLREVLAKEISPPDLDKKVKTYILQNKKPPIGKQQKQLVSGQNYSVFDITLLYFLLRNICSITQHKKKWGNNPEPTDNSVSANIERIRILRNEWYGHAAEISLSDSDFEGKWNHISHIVKELEGYLGTATKYQDILIELKTCCMDPGSIQHYIDTLLTVEELQTDVQNLKEDVDEIKKSIKISNTKESTIEKAIFDQWEQEDSCFVSTKACKEVEKEIKSRNLVIVAGHSGSGKSAIIQHIALKYREQGWTVRRVKKVEDIIHEYSLSQFQKNKTMCVFNDPLGKESFDEILNNLWQTYEEELMVYLKAAKLLVSSRKHIISDTRVTHNLVKQSCIVNIDDNKLKLSVNEKRQILANYTSDMNLSDKDCDKIVEVERHFPLLCKLYSGKENYNDMGIGFFTDSVTVLKEEITGFRNKDKGKYCALALLVLFNDDFCVSDLLSNKETENKFKHTLKLCGLPENTPPSFIGDNLNSMKDFFVKKIGDTYHFYHDFVMEVTTHVFGTDYPAETIKYADIGFLRRRVELGNCQENRDSFVIYLSDRYVEELGERLFTELFGERLLDVVLHPCLRNEKIIKVLKKKMADHPENIQMFLGTKKFKIDERELIWTYKDLLLSKLSFLNLENEVSPLFALIAFCHTQLSQYCINTLKQKQIDFTSCFLFPAMCCNGSIPLFNNAFKDHAEKSLRKTWERLSPIHIVSVFHNYELLRELIKLGENVNQKTEVTGGWTPLMLAAGNDTRENENYNNGESGATQRNKTVEILLRNGADINLCTKNGAGPLILACQQGHYSTVELLLRNGADINLLNKDGSSPFLMACQEGHVSTVQLLLSNGADINLCRKDGASPLFMACAHGHDSTVQFLLNNGADINLCNKDGISPLYAVCQEGHSIIVQLLLSNGADINLYDITKGTSPLVIACRQGHVSTVQLLLSNGAGINLCDEDGASPLTTACLNGHDSTIQFLLDNGAEINLLNKKDVSPLSAACFKGHDSTVQLLLSNGADINLCNKDGASPLLMTCLNGHDSTVQLLLNNGADINLCNKDGASPLIMACPNGHDSTVQLLLSNGADINFCNKDGASPLYAACQEGHVSTVQLLLSNGADINLFSTNGTSPLVIACRQGHDKIVQLLLSKGADINFCNKNGATPLNIACQEGHVSTVELLLSNGADINLCDEDGNSPLIIACRKGHDHTVQCLLSNGADINLCNKDGNSPLIMACLEGNDSTVQLLLSNGADINSFNKNGVTPLYIACQQGHNSTIQHLLSNGADINLCNKDGASPLTAASYKGYNSTVQFLLRNGADINLLNKDGVSPLYMACQEGYDSTVQLLMSNGADINSFTKAGASPLYIACQNGHDRTVQLLLSKGADINFRRKGGDGLLHIVCQKGHDSTVQRLLSNGADINVCDINGVSPLTAACFYGHNSTAQLLLSNGADINLFKKNGASPLYAACQKGNVSTVQLLLSNGADINLCNKNGASPLFIAFRNGHKNIVQLLLSNGADINLLI